MSDDDVYGLALAFDSDSPEFVRGVEIGALWERLRANPDEPCEQTMHLTNAEMALRIGEATDRAVVSQECDDGHWMHVTYGAEGSATG